MLAILFQYVPANTDQTATTHLRGNEQPRSRFHVYRLPETMYKSHNKSYMEIQIKVSKIASVRYMFSSSVLNAQLTLRI
jgi:hypothetical protein